MLPRSLDDLGGLRAARWIRESTARQTDRFGPDAQREQQDRAIERYELTDTGLTWQVSHSGRTIAGTPEFREMLAAAGDTFDVLLVGYVSRFARDLRTAANARHDLHDRGAALLFCDERVLSSDEDQWEFWAREAVEAEAYSRRLGKRIREGFAAKFRRMGDQPGRPAWGLHRGGKDMLLEPDPDTIGDVVRAFELYAAGHVTHEQIAAELRVTEEFVRRALANPIYNGWATRNGERQATPWREDPPVDDVLWERVQERRAERRRGGAQPGKWRAGVDPLGGLLFCECGARIRTNGTGGKPPKRKRLHPAPVCDAWGGTAGVMAAKHDEPIELQVTTLRLDEATIERVTRAVASVQDAPPMARLDTARADRRRRELALEHAAGRLTDEEYLAAVHALRDQQPAPAAPPRRRVDPRVAAARLRDIGRVWDAATEQERADLMHKIYQHITVTREGFVEAELTPDAYELGLALAMRETVVVGAPAASTRAARANVPTTALHAPAQRIEEPRPHGPGLPGLGWEG